MPLPGVPHSTEGRGWRWEVPRAQGEQKGSEGWGRSRILAASERTGAADPSCSTARSRVHPDPLRAPHWASEHTLREAGYAIILFMGLFSPLRWAPNLEGRMKIRTFSIHSAAWAEQKRTAQELLQMPGFGSQRPGSPSQRRHYASLSPAAAARRGPAWPGGGTAANPPQERGRPAAPRPPPRYSRAGRGGAAAGGGGPGTRQRPAPAARQGRAWPLRYGLSLWPPPIAAAARARPGPSPGPPPAAPQPPG